MNQNPTASAIIDPETRAVDEQLWGMSAFFLADWSNVVKLQTGWTTDVVSSQTLAESRAGLRGKPRRIVTADLLAMQPDEVRQLRASMFRSSQARSLIPIYSDFSELTVAALNGDVTLSLDTTNRRFYPGGRVVVVILQNRAMQPSFQLATINTTTTTTITLTTGVVGPLPVGVRVYPLIECKAVGTPQGTMQSDYVMGSTVSAQEFVGVSALPAWELPGTVPAGFANYSGLPILDLPFDWNATPSLGVVRTSQIVDSGLTDIDTMWGNRPVVNGTLNFLLKGRARAVSLLRFFDAVRGRLFPFVCPMPSVEFTMIGNSGSTFYVPINGPVYDWSYVPYISVFNGSTQAIFKVDSVTRNFGANRDEVTVVGTPSWASAIIINPAYIFRFDADEIAEVWQTDDLLSVSLTVHEIPFDEEVDTIIVPPGGGGPNTPDYDPWDSTTPGLCTPSIIATHTVPAATTISILGDFASGLAGVQENTTRKWQIINDANEHLYGHGDVSEAGTLVNPAADANADSITFTVPTNTPNAFFTFYPVAVWWAALDKIEDWVKNRGVNVFIWNRAIWGNHNDWETAHQTVQRLRDEGYNVWVIRHPAPYLTPDHLTVDFDIRWQSHLLGFSADDELEDKIPGGGGGNIDFAPTVITTYIADKKTEYDNWQIAMGLAAQTIPMFLNFNGTHVDDAHEATYTAWVGAAGKCIVCSDNYPEATQQHNGGTPLWADEEATATNATRCFTSWFPTVPIWTFLATCNQHLFNAGDHGWVYPPWIADGSRVWSTTEFNALMGIIDGYGGAGLALFPQAYGGRIIDATDPALIPVIVAISERENSTVSDGSGGGTIGNGGGSPVTVVVEVCCVNPDASLTCPTITPPVSSCGDGCPDQITATISGTFSATPGSTVNGTYVLTRSSGCLPTWQAEPTDSNGCTFTVSVDMTISDDAAHSTFVLSATTECLAVDLPAYAFILPNPSGATPGSVLYEGSYWMTVLCPPVMEFVADSGEWDGTPYGAVVALGGEGGP